MTYTVFFFCSCALQEGKGIHLKYLWKNGRLIFKWSKFRRVEMKLSHTQLILWLVEILIVQFNLHVLFTLDFVPVITWKGPLTSLNEH